MAKLTSNEFLTLYTGVLLGESFDVAESGVKKVSGNIHRSVNTIECAQQFRLYIDQHRPDLVKEVRQIGRFRKNDQEPIMDQINRYVNAFEQIHGSKLVEVEKIQFKSKDEGMSR